MSYAAISADGTTLAVGITPSTHPFIATSTNAGTTWTSNSLPFYCSGVAASADGKKLAAVEPFLAGAEHEFRVAGEFESARLESRDRRAGA